MAVTRPIPLDVRVTVETMPRHRKPVRRPEGLDALVDCQTKARHTCPPWSPTMMQTIAHRVPAAACPACYPLQYAARFAKHKAA